jgi:hypothetical protein
MIPIPVYLLSVLCWRNKRQTKPQTCRNQEQPYCWINPQSIDKPTDRCGDYQAGLLIATGATRIMAVIHKNALISLLFTITCGLNLRIEPAN